MHDADTLALHGVQPRRRRVQHHIHKAIVQQVDLIHVQDAAVGLGLRNWTLAALLQTHHPSSSGVTSPAHRMPRVALACAAACRVFVNRHRPLCKQSRSHSTS